MKAAPPAGLGSLAGNVFIATSADIFFPFRNAATTAGDYAEIKPNITVKPLNLEDAFLMSARFDYTVPHS